MKWVLAFMALFCAAPATATVFPPAVVTTNPDDITAGNGSGVSYNEINATTSIVHLGNVTSLGFWLSSDSSQTITYSINTFGGYIGTVDITGGVPLFLGFTGILPSTTPGIGTIGLRYSSPISISGLVVGAAYVPEPATWAMMLLGLGMIGFTLRARRRSSGLIERTLQYRA